MMCCEALIAVLQALIQYPDPNSAGSAKQALEGHAIYEGGCNKVCLAQPATALPSVHCDVLDPPRRIGHP